MPAPTSSHNEASDMRGEKVDMRPKFKVSFLKSIDDPEKAEELEDANEENRRNTRQRLHDINDHIDDNQVSTRAKKRGRSNHNVMPQFLFLPGPNVVQTIYYFTPQTTPNPLYT
jgi:hypothetical protein